MNTMNVKILFYLLLFETLAYVKFGVINYTFVHYYRIFQQFPSNCMLSGTGLAAVFINISVENFAGWKFALTFAIIQKSYVAGFLVYILINLVLVYSSVYIITQFAPAAAGSGIPEIKGYLNGIRTLFFFFLPF